MGCRWVADAPLWLRFLHAPLAGPLFVATDIRRGANDTPPQPRERRPGFTHGCFVCTCPCAESRISPLNASCTITNYLGLHTSVNLTGHGHRPPVVACVVEDGTQRAGETPSTVLSTRERSAPSSPAMHRPSPGSCPCLLWPIGVANPGEPEAAWSSASGLHAAFQCGPPLPTGRGTSWPDFEASREVRSRSHSSSSGLTAPIGPSLMRARVPVCAHRCDRAWGERAQRRRLDHHHPGDRRHGQRRRIRALPPPAQPSKLGARRVQKVEPTHVCRDANSR